MTKPNREHAQGTVEFALILPILLLMIVGIMEMGRLLFFYSSVVSASREGARYAASVGEYSGVPRYQDCDGIRDAALKAGSFAGLEVGDIEIYYDDGNTTITATCPPTDRIDLKDRVVVSASGTFNPIVPLIGVFFPEGGLDINSVTGRTLIKDVGIQGTPHPTDTPVPTPTPVCPSTSLTVSSEDEVMTVSISNPDIEHVYYLQEIYMDLPNGNPYLETITFTSPYTASLTLAPHKKNEYQILPDDPDVKPFIWYGRFANPGVMQFTFDEDLTPNDLYKIKVKFSLCPYSYKNYTVPDD